MATKRIVSTSFWTDRKVDTFSPEDKYFMLYLLTNPHTTQLGIYEFSIKHAAFEMGYSTETILALLDRFQNRYKVIMYSEEYGEIAIKNYLKHSIVKGGKPVFDCLKKEIGEVKDQNLIRFVCDANTNNENETVVSFIKYIKENYNNIFNDNDNENENDNERIVDDSYHDSCGVGKKPVLVKKQDAVDGFDAFWAVYPRHESKAVARKAWNKLKPSAELQEIMGKALMRQKQSPQWNKDGGQYIPYASTWLNQRRWEDEVKINDTQDEMFARVKQKAIQIDRALGKENAGQGGFWDGLE